MSESFSSEDLRHLFLDLRQMKSFVADPLVIERAEGVWYWDTGGRKILDGISGIFVVTVGHRNRRIIEAIREQLELCAFSPPLHATNLPAIRLARLLASILPGDLQVVKLLSDGSEATESAMKLARQYHRQTGNPGKYKVIARYQGYHGATMGALSATGTKRRKSLFEPALAGYLHVMPPTCYRCPYGLEYPGCRILCATQIGDVIEAEDSATVSAVIVEPIGNTGGVVTPPPEYLPIVRDICTKNQVLLIFDEIITGFGRTGNMFAAQTFDTVPDIMCLGKGMSSGYAPLAGIAFRQTIADAFWGEERDGIEFAHGHTYGGNPVSSAAGLACVTEIIERKLCDRARELGALLREELRRVADLGVVGEIRGKGLLLGVEFVRNPGTKRPFEDGINFGIHVGKAALRRGLLLRCDPNWIALAPPLIIDEQELRLMVDILVESVRETIASLGRTGGQ